MSTQIASPVPSGLPEGLAEHRLLTSDEAALLLGVPVATLRTWRSRRRGYGPRAVQVGGSIRYRLADLLAWIEDHTENADGNVAEGIEPSKRGKTSPADLPPHHPAATARPHHRFRRRRRPRISYRPLTAATLSPPSSWRSTRRHHLMARNPLHPGEIGKIRTEQIRPGLWRADASFCDRSGAKGRCRKSGRTQTAARRALAEELKERIELENPDGPVTPTSRVNEAVETVHLFTAIYWLSCVLLPLLLDYLIARDPGIFGLCPEGSAGRSPWHSL